VGIARGAAVGLGSALLLGTVPACKGSERGKAAVEVSQALQRDQALSATESELLSKRRALQRERKRVKDERTAIVEQIRQLPANSRAQQQALEQQYRELDSAESALVDQELALTGRLDQMLKERSALLQRLATTTAVAKEAATSEVAIARREQSMASRETELAKREGELAAREKELASRESAVLRLKREQCAAAPVTTTVIRTEPPPEGLRYTRADVEPNYRRALKTMTEKGLLPADLPGGGARLIDEIREKMEGGEYVKAKYAADQLNDLLKDVKVDRPFLSNKIQRLAGQIKQKSLDPAQRNEVDELFRDATNLYSDGKLAGANQRINKIYALLTP
jgi:uncharacterized protein (DUF3084 family)